jgi:hypothetical protein
VSGWITISASFHIGQKRRSATQKNRPAGSHPRSRSLGREHGELLAEGQILDQKVGPLRGEASEPIQDGGNSGEHRDRTEGAGASNLHPLVSDPVDDPARSTMGITEEPGAAMEMPIHE